MSILSPNEVPGLQLWFDASDVTTIVKDSSSRVGRWSNKATQGTRSGYYGFMYTQTPVPPTPRTPPSVFDVFAQGNENGFTRFKRMRLLGYV